MKKIITAVAIVCAAVVANAAAVQWDAGTVLLANGDTANKSVNGYLFAIDATAYASYASMSAADLSQAIWADFGGKTGDAIANGTTSKRGALTLEGIDVAAGGKVYAALLYVDTTSQLGDPTFMGNVASVEWAGVGTPGVSELANLVGGTGAATSWQTKSEGVPEPTSALLMLLGMAGLALRRRHA